MSKLFQSIRLRGLTLDNRIVLSPMCQYSAADGSAGDWHLMHLGQYAVSGIGLIIVEMTNVELRGRISPGCLALENDANEAALKRVAEFCRSAGPAKLGIQIAHAGRKASTVPPWLGRRALRPDEGAWQTVAPSPVPMYDDDPVPHALSRGEIRGIVDRFVEAARRADRIGFDAIEVHGAHGYLLHQFLSPLSNRREDEYGGALANRMRFALEVFAAMRAAWPADKPMGMRLSATDWVEGGWDPDGTVALARELRRLGCDWIDVTSGGLSAAPQVPAGPGYHAPFSARIRREADIPTICVGLVTESQQAEEIVASGKADMVALARGLLYDPRWVWHAARELGANAWYPNQYLRARP